MRYLYIIVAAFTLMSCRKSLQPEPAEQKGQVSVNFTASAYDTTARLNVRIFDTNSGHVYQTTTTARNEYNGTTDIVQGTSVTFSVTSTVHTNITSQVVTNNQAVATGNFNALQSQGLPPQLVLYYKIP